MSVVLEKRLRALKKRAAGGDAAAAGQAQLLEQHLKLKVVGASKKEDDRVKVLVGAAVLNSIQHGHPPDLSDGRAAVLALLDDFLSRPAERLAVLGEDGRGSPAFHRCTR
ncbi:MAG: hypothetical protein GX782_11485 [Gammaproteobacteria bacterium]|nr:hypothetical protein [Gammaproteobacteria bacterium]